MRVHIVRSRMTMRQADMLEYFLARLDYVSDVKVFDRTGDAIINYSRTDATREALISALAKFCYEDEELMSLVPEHTGRELRRKYETKLVLTILGRAFRRMFFPAPLRIVWTIAQSTVFIAKAVKSLLKGKLEVAVLDAVAICAAMLRSDFETASSIMFLLTVGDVLEDWTRKKSTDDLARSLSLNVDKVWLKTADGDVLVDVNSVRTGDLISVGTSNIIPLDGKVISGSATVNQASMTGESVPVVKMGGGYVYAGTVVEEGNIVIEVSGEAGSGKYDQIVRMIEDTEKLKSNTEAAVYKLADGLVPYSLAGAALTWLLTRNINKALAFLMVDFSCALKMSMPLTVLSAIREAGEHNIMVKGGKFLEAVAEADVVVFDKTGTLTHATPSLVGIETFSGKDETEMLRIAACLEEHYPHSVANAVVKAAESRGIAHSEMHSEVKYVVAHGIASSIDGQRALIGSHHFIFEDENCTVDEAEKDKLAAMPTEYSHLYLAIDGKLVAALHIFDPLREEACDIINSLHELGISKICMLTGDNEKTAAAIAEKLNIDEYRAEVLPADKAVFVKREKEAGHKVIMIGDGVNDTPALSEADCGIAVSSGAPIAREIADITISSDGLQELLFLRRLSQAMMKRIKGNYNFIISFNAALIALGVSSILPPSSSALLHNGSTIAAGLHSMTDLIKEE